jgi:PAS domain S-box-containing protein
VKEMIERQLAKLLEGTSDAAFAVDILGDVRIWNKSAEKLFGYPASIAIGNSCTELIGGSLGTDASVCRESCDILECVRKSRVVTDFDMKIKSSSGKLVWVNVSLLSATDEKTEKLLIVHFMRDISERKRTEHLTKKMLKIAKDIVNGTNESNGLPPISPLTDQETSILRRLASGTNTSNLGADLRISLATLRNHISHINKKLHTKNRLESVAEALKRGLI